MSFHMRRCKSLFGGLLAVLVLFGGPARAGIEERANAFLRSLVDQAVKSLTEADTPRPERIKQFRSMFRGNFAVRSIGKFVLGRNWRRATDVERKEYMVLFEDLMVLTYVDRFQRYAGVSLKIKKTRVDTESIVTVFSEIERPDGAKPIRVDWRVGTNGTIYKLLDVIVEGTSMSNTLRSDFGSIVRREGNQIGGLMAVLREKTAALKAKDNE
jgi:phospholipid transport system substrate-binding protein